MMQGVSRNACAGMYDSVCTCSYANYLYIHTTWMNINSMDLLLQVKTTNLSLATGTMYTTVYTVYLYLYFVMCILQSARRYSLHRDRVWPLGGGGGTKRILEWTQSRGLWSEMRKVHVPYECRYLYLVHTILERVNEPIATLYYKYSDNTTSYLCTSMVGLHIHR